MKDGFIKVARRLPKSRLRTAHSMLSSVISLIAEAEAKGAAVIVFPELCLTEVQPAIYFLPTRCFRARRKLFCV